MLSLVKEYDNSARVILEVGYTPEFENVCFNMVSINPEAEEEARFKVINLMAIHTNEVEAFARGLLTLIGAE